MTISSILRVIHIHVVRIDFLLESGDSGAVSEGNGFPVIGEGCPRFWNRVVGTGREKKESNQSSERSDVD